VPADVQLDGISKHYGTVRALEPLVLSIARGEFFTLLGPSGCGKTTLLRLVGGFLQPTSGRIILGGRDVTALPPERRPTAMVFQDYALFPHMTVADNIAFGPRAARRPEGAVRRTVERCLEIVRLSGLAARRPAQLSGGQQQRVALARALAVEPEVLLLDEPLSALDAKLRETMQGELKRIQGELGVTAIYVTHDQHEALALSDRIAVMREGVVQQVGTPQDIYRRPRQRFVADFIGRVNLLPGVLDPSAGRLVTDVGTFAVAPGHGVSERRAMLLAVRPESLRLGAARPETNAVMGIVAKLRYLGTGFEYSIALAGGLVVTADDAVPEARFKPGDAAHAWWDVRDGVLVPVEDSVPDSEATQEGRR
jgi:ABC-type Fe3+/spermidine/putrescine transport system ATPase subunit